MDACFNRQNWMSLDLNVLRRVRIITKVINDFPSQQTFYYLLQNHI